jgi:acyl-CoA synthetase (AMP-forming)/AMP-acid ligase II
MVLHLQVVILHSFNCIEYPVVFFALNRIGAICSPTSPLFTPQELADQINLAKVRVINARNCMTQRMQYFTY